MNPQFIFASIASLIIVSTSCTNTIKSDSNSRQLKPIVDTGKDLKKDPPKQLDVKWLIKSKNFDDRSLIHQVFLVVNGQEHKIENEVYSLKAKGEYGPHNAESRKAYQAISGYNFEWHVSSADFYVRKEDSNLVVYAEESSDENEGRADIRKIKTIIIE